MLTDEIGVKSCQKMFLWCNKRLLYLKHLCGSEGEEETLALGWNESIKAARITLSESGSIVGVS
jgi:hypothetical protein